MLSPKGKARVLQTESGPPVFSLGGVSCSPCGTPPLKSVTHHCLCHSCHKQLRSQPSLVIIARILSQQESLHLWQEKAQVSPHLSCIYGAWEADR